MKYAIVALLLAFGTAHAALRNGPRPTTPTNPTPTTGGGSPTTTCLVFPDLCVR